MEEIRQEVGLNADQMQVGIRALEKAGHASYSTTRRYVKLAGVVFPDAAAARERRLLGEHELSTEVSTNLTAPDSISGNLTARSEAGEHPADLR